MQLSEHFDLNLVEGTDIVNPLVIDKPNYEKIDAQMFANQSATVGTATELTSNTIHALTRLNGNTNVFRFTATSRFDLGDSFTVDGISVTALLPNGKALGDGAYIIGSTVLCSLVGTLLTVYTFSVAEADDSKKLGGELPAYYAKQTDLDSTQLLAEGAASVAQSVQSDVSALIKTTMVQVECRTYEGGWYYGRFTAPASDGYTPISLNIGVVGTGVNIAQNCGWVNYNNNKHACYVQSTNAITLTVLVVYIKNTSIS